MSGEAPGGRAFLLVAGYVCGALAGAWLGFAAAFVSGMVLVGRARVGGEDLAAALAAGTVLAVTYILVRRAVGRVWARGLLFAATFAALDLLYALYALAPPELLCMVPQPGVETSTAPTAAPVLHQEPLSECRASAPPLLSLGLAAAMVPAALVGILLCSAAVRRNALLQSVGFATGALFALAGLLLSLARAFV